MLRYADYIDPASNLYEVPRPPRRGSHRPEAPAFGKEPWRNVSPTGLNGVRCPSSPPLSFPQVSVAPVTSGFSLLGKNPTMMKTTSPSLTKEAAKFVNINRSSALTRGAFAARSFTEQPTREQAFSRLSRSARGQSTSISDGFEDRYLSEEGGSNNRVKEEFLPLRHSFDGVVKCESIRAPTSASPSSALVDLVDQMNARKGGRYSPSILESYAKTIPLSASCQTVQKRCMYPDCTKISVSRGLCRGHGGGRRCHFLGCAKSAQSRSNFCWAHGGGQRCDVPNCMRSRKSKRFCVAHIQFENLVAFEQNKQPRTDIGNGASLAPKRFYERDSGGEGRRRHSQQQEPPVQPCKQQAPVMQRRYLPSLGQALSSASRSPPNLPGNFGAYGDACTRVD